MRAPQIRFSGMASGMDTDSIVKDMMRPHQYKIDQEKKAQALVKLKQDAWKDMNKKLYDFHTKFTHKLSQKGSYSKSSIVNSNENAISIDNKGAVPEGTHQFEITQLATSTTAVGDLGKDSKATRAMKISDLAGIGEGESFDLTINVDGVDITSKVKASDTLGGLVTEMNKNLKDSNVRVSFDEKNKKFFVSSTTTGEKEITFKGSFNDGNVVQNDTKLFRSLGLLEKGGSAHASVNNGKNAIFEYNGAVLESSSNSIEVNGIQATLKAENVGEIITIAAEQDTDQMYDFIKDFIEEYNVLIADLNEKVASKPGMDIEPLSSDEREAMSDSEIKLWEDKLEESLFYKDPQIQDFLDTSRRVLGRDYGNDLGGGNPYRSLASLGIVPGSWEERGQLHIRGDEDDPLAGIGTNRLKEAIANNPDDVIALFTKIGDELYKTNREKIKSSSLNSALTFYHDKAMDKQVKDIDKRILTLEERMYQMEERQYAKFAAMESMLHKLNSQGDWLMQQFGGMY